MLGAQLCSRSTLHGLRSFTDQPFTSDPFPNRLSLRLLQPPFTSFKPKSVFVTCKYSRGSFSPKSHHDRGNEYLEASVLISETVKHSQLLKQGFQEEVNWNLYGHSLPLSQATCPNIDHSLGLEFLRRFQSPTIFVKISCDGDFLLPIVVGEYAIEKLMDSLHEDDNWFARNLVTQQGYQVGERETFSIDARPSDALNLARKCKVRIWDLEYPLMAQAPIYVNKQFVLTDAIRISYRAGQAQCAKPCYDVQLDSVLEGPNLLAEELYVVKNLHLAVREERYLDEAFCAAMLRDKLIKLQKSS